MDKCVLGAHYHGKVVIDLEQGTGSDPYLDPNATNNLLLNGEDGVEMVSTSVFKSNFESVAPSILDINFINSIPDLSSYSVKYDLSKLSDGTIMAWIDGTTLYIGSNGRIIAPVDCSLLFTQFTSVTNISFNGYFDTSNVINMNKMFYGCSSLKDIDLSFLDFLELGSCFFSVTIILSVFSGETLYLFENFIFN